MLGSFAVGKTSLVSQFVHSIFSEKYLTTVGVKIDKKVVQVRDEDVNLILWDLAGEDEFMQVRISYMRGSSGYLLVADGTRRDTLETAIDLQRRVETQLGNIPFILVVNKFDIVQEWEIEQGKLDEISTAGWHVYRTSARTGDGVEEVFRLLAEKTLNI
jgi:small GTP-binding protein